MLINIKEVEMAPGLEKTVNAEMLWMFFRGMGILVVDPEVDELPLVLRLSAWFFHTPDQILIEAFPGVELRTLMFRFMDFSPTRWGYDQKAAVYFGSFRGQRLHQFFPATSEVIFALFSQPFCGQQMGKELKRVISLSRY